MANVFTKKHHRARTTTLRDFGPLYSSAPLLPRRARILSPTRRCNPHPTGLVFQSPYNRDNTTFDIWNPDFVKISKRMPNMFQNLTFKNFSCDVAPGRPYRGKIERRIEGGIPPIANSTHRATYQTPSFPDDINCEPIKTTRFGYTPREEARGIVPNLLPPIHQGKGLTDLTDK